MFHVYKTPSLHAGYRNYNSHPLIYPLLAIFNACFTQFKQDLITLVEDGVLASVSQAVARNNNAQTPQTKARLKACKNWVDSQFPFSMDQETVANLIVAISSRPNMKGSLPYTDDYSPLTLKGLAHTVINIAQSKSASVSFPFISKSPTIPLLRVAYFIANTHLASLTDQPRTTMIVNAISIVINELKLHNFPAPSPRNPGARGPPSIKPVYDSWISLDNVRAEIATIAHTLVHQSNNPHAITALTVRDHDKVSETGEWTIASISLNDMPTYINKTVTPTDINFAGASLKQYSNPLEKGHYVYQHYLWLMSIIDLKNPIHRLVVWAARIFAALGPNLAPDPTFHAPVCRSQDDYINATKLTPLYEPSNRKGLKASGPIVILFTGMALGLIYKDSPISKHISEVSARESLGEWWTNKHGMFITFHSSSILTSHNT